MEALEDMNLLEEMGNAKAGGQVDLWIVILHANDRANLKA